MTINIRSMTEFSIEVLIALFERAVGFYAMLVNIDAYHQPGVEAGKKAAAAALTLQSKVRCFLLVNRSNWFTAAENADSIASSDAEHVFMICERLSANPSRCVISTKSDKPLECEYSKTQLSSCLSTQSDMT